MTKIKTSPQQQHDLTPVK